MKTIITWLKVSCTFCAILFLFSTCGKPSYVQLTDEELAWVVYTESEVLKFRADSGNTTVTYTAFNKFRGYIVNGNQYNEKSGISFKVAKDTINGSLGLFYIYKEPTGSNSISLTWPYFTGTVNISTTVPVKDTINGILYKDIYVGHATSTFGVNYIKTVYYSKAAGMVQFMDRNSVYWHRVN